MRRPALLIIALIGAITVSGHGQDPSPLPDRTVDKTGYVAALQRIEHPRIAWKYTSPSEQGNSPGLSDAAAAHGMLFFGDDLGTVHAYTARHGAKIWSHKHGHRVFHAPTSDGRQVYFTTDQGVTALNAATGLEVWQHPIENGGGRCLVHEGQVYCGGSDGVMYALDAENGRPIWQASLMQDVVDDPPGFDGQRARLGDSIARPSGISCDGQFVYQSVFDQCRVVAFDCRTGEQHHSFQTGGWIFADAAVDDQRLYVGSQDKSLYCWNKVTGQLLWKHATGSRIESGPAVDHERVVIASCDGKVYCLQKTNGAFEWAFTTDGDRKSIYSAPILTQDTVYLAAAAGYVYAIDVRNGHRQWVLQPSPDSHLYTSPATDGSRIFVKSRPIEQGVGEDSIFAIGDL